MTTYTITVTPSRMSISPKIQGWQIFAEYQCEDGDGAWCVVSRDANDVDLFGGDRHQYFSYKHDALDAVRAAIVAEVGEDCDIIVDGTNDE